MDEEDRKRVPKTKDLWIDIGAKDRKDAEKHVAIGDPVTFTYGFERLLNDLVVARGFDDRIGAFVVAEVLKALAGKKLPVGVYARVDGAGGARASRREDERVRHRPARGHRRGRGLRDGLPGLRPEDLRRDHRSAKARSWRAAPT